MTITLQNIKPTANAVKKKKRVGRGNASGSGTYSGRGLKGQKARSGVSNLKRLGMRQILRRTPKKHGFKTNKPDNQVVNFDRLNLYFKDGDLVSPTSLKAKGLIKKIDRPVKILARGHLKLKNLKFNGVIMGGAAAEQLK